MNINLPREFLWQDYKTMDEFLKDPLNQELYKVYKQTKDAPFKITMPDIKVFNELYYQVVKFCYCEVSAENIANSVCADLGFVYSKDLIISMIFAIICLQKKKMYELEYMLKEYLGNNRGWYLDLFNNFVNDSKTTYDSDLTPKPIDVESAVAKVKNWPEITNYFSKYTLNKIINLWPGKEEKLYILNTIFIAYSEFIRNGTDKFPHNGYIYDDDTVDETIFNKMIQKIKSSKKLSTTQTIKCLYKKKTDSNFSIEDYLKNYVEDSKITTERETPSCLLPIVIKTDLAEKIFKLINENLKDKKDNKDKMRPFAAAIAANVIRPPKWSEFVKAYGYDFVKRSSFYNQLKAEAYPGDNIFNWLKCEFLKMVQTSEAG